MYKMMNFKSDFISWWKSPIMLKFGIIFAVIGHNGELCCNMKNQEFRDVLNECGLNTENFNRLTCEIMDCAFDKLKLLKDGKLNQDALGAMFDEDSIKLPDFKEVLMKTKENCVKDLSAVATHIPCDSIKLFLCGQRCLIADCPDEFWNNSDECSKVKQFVEKCPSIF